MKNTLLLLLLALGACDPAKSTCRCVGDVPEGHLDLACGQLTCLKGGGYVCTAANMALPSAEACTAINGDPCSGVVCNQPPAGTCVNSFTVRAPSPTGTCANGQCSYAQTTTNCPYGCQAGACNTTDPCAASDCVGALPASVCTDANTLTDYETITCSASGACGYPPTIKTCSGGCANGACNSNCPLNSTVSSQVGPSVFTGSFLTESGSITTSCLGTEKGLGLTWQAPAAGVYTFSASCNYDFTGFGESPINNNVVSADIVVGNGSTCAAASFPTCATGAKPPLTMTLTAGQQVMLAIASYCGLSDQSFTVTRADYAVAITSCQPSCSGKSCGDDGCGGSCGTCGAHLSCSAGACVCAPNCSGKSCGDNGCGASCGTCPVGDTCSSGGQCICTPDCSGKTCGANGCGGSCGTCGLGTSCSGTSCVADPNACDPVANAGCTNTNQCILLSNETTQCALAGSGTQGSSCSATVTCAGGYSCFAGSCRKICALSGGAGCSPGYVCNGVTNWFTYGACASM